MRTIRQRVLATMDKYIVSALKIAFTYMPRSIEITKFEYGDSYQNVLQPMQAVKEIVLIDTVDPDEVYGEINSQSTANSTD